METVTNPELTQLEGEVRKIISDYEEEKQKQKILNERIKHLKQEIRELTEFKEKYQQAANEIMRLQEALQKKESHSNDRLSEKDIAEVMITAKITANEIINKAKLEAAEFEKVKDKTFEALKNEGKLLQEQIGQLKTKIDNDLTDWHVNVDKLIETSEKENKLKKGESND